MKTLSTEALMAGWVLELASATVNRTEDGEAEANPITWEIEEELRSRGFDLSLQACIDWKEFKEQQGTW